ncbi:MAG: Rsd/AlgQ family anti-sigma factor [Gammaproteobacteria bacterium]|nr:MAG: Rsd/AlgQ family anti-sigma factor [Gammaproteobacteria bacterium]
MSASSGSQDNQGLHEAFPGDIPEFERRHGTMELVNKLTEERAQMLLLFCRVAGVEPYYDKPNRSNLQPLLQQLCQVLIDYMAVGHFSLYERIINGHERRKEIGNIAEALYPRISQTTEVALDFNDKYDCEDHCDISRDFEKDLSTLGEALAIRIDAEDQLVKAIC